MSDYHWYDHKLSSEIPFEVQEFSGGEKIPQKVIDMHPTVHLGIVLKGSILAWIDGHEKEIRQGNLWLTAPSEPHTSLAQSHDNEALVVTFLLEELGQGFIGSQLPLLRPFSLEAEERLAILSRQEYPEMLRLGHELRDLSRNGNDVYFRAQQWMLFKIIYVEVLRLLATARPAADTPDWERITPALFLPKQKAGVPISLQEAAQSCHLSESRFSELFRNCTGNTFHQYEIRYRLSGARSELLRSRRTLKEIAGHWGFYDTNHFLHTFRRFYGMTPGECRRKNIF